jgi:NAD(P)-dependent dehydrogenase (short-subunit alcohol dehydrogenase family)
MENRNRENRITGIKYDVLMEKDLKAANDQIRSESGRIDIHVNAAGGHVSEAVIIIVLMRSHPDLLLPIRTGRCSQTRMTP